MNDYQDFSDEDLSHLEDPTEIQMVSKQGRIAPQDLPDPLYRVKVEHSAELLYASSLNPINKSFPCNVIIQTRYGRDLGILLGLIKTPGYIDIEEIVSIERIANSEDMAHFTQNIEREREAFQICRGKIETHKLSMKLVSAHYMLDEPKVLFFFTAETRVDFRELVKDLVSIFKMRIELRQIGVRDEARVLGGIGVCGRVFCCHSISDKLNAVSIKMAKDQNLSLNSMKISGPCGRLLCCLSYEYAFYRDERRYLPLEGSRFDYDGTTFKITEINLLYGKIKLHGEDGRSLELDASNFKRNENGKWAIIPPENQEKN